MNKFRRIIVGIIFIIYIILILMKIDIPQNVFISLLFIVLGNQVIDEWLNYKDTKRKVHLLIPISALLLVIYAVTNLMYLTLNK